MDIDLWVKKAANALTANALTANDIHALSNENRSFNFHVINLKTVWMEDSLEQKGSRGGDGTLHNLFLFLLSHL